MQERSFTVCLPMSHEYSLQAPPSTPAHSVSVLHVTNSPKPSQSFTAPHWVPPPKTDAQQIAPASQSAASSQLSLAVPKPLHFMFEAVHPASPPLLQQTWVPEVHSVPPQVILPGFEPRPPDEVDPPSPPPSPPPPLDEVDEPPPLEEPPDEEAAPDEPPPPDEEPPPSVSVAAGVSSSPPQPAIAPDMPHANNEPPLMIKT